MDAGEDNLGVVAEVGAEVEVAAMVVTGRRVGIQVVKVVSGAAFLVWVLIVKVKPDPDGHVAPLGARALEDDVRVVHVRDDLVDWLAAVPR